MPIYEYHCAKCEREFEVEQRITDAPLKTCPHCRSRRVKRLISQTSFTLKGGGWYADGYATKAGDAKPGSDAKPDAEPKSGGESTGAAASDAVPAKDAGGATEKPKGAKSKKAVA